MKKRIYRILIVSAAMFFAMVPQRWGYSIGAPNAPLAIYSLIAQYIVNWTFCSTVYNWVSKRLDLTNKTEKKDESVNQSPAT